MLAFNPEQKKIYKENLDLLYDERVLNYRENHPLCITEWKLVIAARRSYLRGILKYTREKKDFHLRKYLLWWIMQGMRTAAALETYSHEQKPQFRFHTIPEEHTRWSQGLSSQKYLIPKDSTVLFMEKLCWVASLCFPWSFPKIEEPVYFVIQLVSRESSEIKKIFAKQSELTVIPNPDASQQEEIKLIEQIRGKELWDRGMKNLHKEVAEVEKREQIQKKRFMQNCPSSRKNGSK